MAEAGARFVWYELMATDADAAEAFYRAVVGWGAQPMETPGVRYTMLTVQDRPVGGLMALIPEMVEAGARPGWIGYVGVAEVDAATERLRAAGGQVHRPPGDIPGVGRFSVVADPQGAAFMLFTPNAGSAGALPTAPTAGHIGWHELHAADGVSAFAFYAEQFGWTKDMAVDMGPMGVYQTFAVEGQQVGGMMTDTQGPPGWLFYFGTDDIDAAAARVEANGGKVVRGPHEVPGGGFILVGTDPEGVTFAMTGPRTRPKEA